jgi:D-alanine-D-alanine ligase
VSVPKTRLVVLFGGRSAEHDVSCVSAVHVLRAIDLDRYEVVPIGITREGTWVRPELPGGGLAQRVLPAMLEAAGEEVAPLSTVEPSSAPGPVVVLPILHGPFGEDGTVQGLLELAGVPYVGAGVLGSALAMDKAAAKDMLSAAGIPQARWLALREPVEDPSLAARVGGELGWPVFVKPANLGSSVGVSRATGPEELRSAIARAASFDEWVVVEEAIDGREIECGVLGNLDPKASVPGEIVPSRDFYDYEDKYVTDGAKLAIPAPLDEATTAEVRRLAVDAFRALDCDGMARVDFFYVERERRLLVNEVNTIPGFTPISMYPKLWQASGLGYAGLVDRLVELAVERHQRRRGRIGRARE